MSLEGIDDVHSSDGFSAGVLSVGDCIADDSFEEAAQRELEEETGVFVSFPALRYVGSKRVNDWRYANNPSEKIMTHLYVGLYGENSNGPRADDDIAEVRWFGYDYLTKSIRVMPEDSGESIVTTNAAEELVEEHLPLWEMLKTYIDTNFPLKKGQKPNNSTEEG